jgi:16S rRNA (cytosine1402-N4)-methyltransferase
LTDFAGAWDTAYHAPALVREVVDALAGAATILDGTLGGGGHAAALLAAGARVDGVDRDPEAIASALARLADAARSGRFRAFVANFSALDLVPALDGLQYGGVLLDLGVSSHQLDDPTRGFSFRRGELLDMRMSAAASAPAGGESTAAAVTAAETLNTASEAELMTIFREYADEPKAARLARTLVHRRGRHPLATSDDLVDAIRAALGPRSGPPDFARLFQAVRMAVNDERGALETALPALRDRLLPTGRLAVIAYHSGEDRIVKRTFRDWSLACRCPPRQPVCTCGGALGTLVTRRPIVADRSEVEKNPRARSAKLRVWERAA